MRKRVLSLILLLCMLTAFCPIPAQAYGTPINSVDLLIDDLVAGEYPDYWPSIAGSDTGYHVRESTSGYPEDFITWFDETEMLQMSSYNTFQANHVYKVIITLEAEDGFLFHADTHATVNGHTADAWAIDGNICQVSYKFPKLFIPISSASVTITPPSVGAKPDYKPVLPAGAHYYSDASWSDPTTVNDVWWTDETAGCYLDTTEAFIAGHTYTVWMELTPESGYSFSIGSTAKVNGKTALVVLYENADDAYYLRIRYTFPALPSQPDGWQVTGGKYYYYKSGAVQTDWVWVPEQGSYFYLDPSTGAWTGWVFYKNNMYFYDTSSGSFKTGWLLYNGNLYYFNPATNAMMTGWVYEGGKFYYFNPSTGALQVGWVWVADQETYFYIDPSTGAWTGWLYYHGNTYFYDTVINNFWTGWLQYNGYYFYLDPATGIMVTGTKVIGGKTYQFNSYGVCIG